MCTILVEGCDIVSISYAAPPAPAVYNVFALLWHVEIWKKGPTSGRRTTSVGDGGAAAAPPLCRRRRRTTSSDHHQHHTLLLWRLRTHWARGSSTEIRKSVKKTGKKKDHPTKKKVVIKVSPIVFIIVSWSQTLLYIQTRDNTRYPVQSFIFFSQSLKMEALPVPLSSWYYIYSAPC